MSPITCKKGYIKRKAYDRVTKNGTIVHVPSSCIKSTRSPGYKNEKRSVWEKRILAKKERSHLAAEKYFKKHKLDSTKTCPKGYILKPAYKRHSYNKKKSGVHVKSEMVHSTCVKKKGLSNSVNKIGPLEKDLLKPFGYNHVTSMKLADRKIALTKAVRVHEWLPIFRRLNVLSIFNRNTNPKASEIFLRDRNWVRSNFSS